MNHKPFGVSKLFESILSQLPKATRSLIVLECEQGVPSLCGDIRVLRFVIVELLTDALRLNRAQSLAIRVGLTADGNYLWIRFQGWHWGVYRFTLSLLRMTIHSFSGKFEAAIDPNSFRGMETNPGHILPWLPTHDTWVRDSVSPTSQ
jgi:hypothetical protein